jgi:hypothetical protein
MSVSDCIAQLELASISMAQSHIEKFKKKQKQIFTETLKASNSIDDNLMNIILDSFNLSQDCINNSELLGKYNDLCMEITESITLPDHYKYARTSGVLNNSNSTKETIIREEINNNILFSSKTKTKTKTKKSKCKVKTEIIEESDNELCEDDIRL